MYRFMNTIINKRIRGVNFGGWFSQVDAIEEKDPNTFSGLYEHIENFVGEDDFQRVKEWGFDHIRLPVDYFNVFSPQSLKPDETALSLLDQAIDGIIKVGLSVIFDLHKCPGHDFDEGTTQEQAFFTDPLMREDAKQVWSHLAERYGNRPEVGLEILNEPVAPTAELWNEVKAEMAAHIRKLAPRSTIIVASNRWNHASTFGELTPLEDDNILYSFHYYLPLLFTHQKAPWLPGEFFQQKRAFPGNLELPEGIESRLPLETGYWDRDAMERSLKQVIRFMEKYGLPVSCNEFGVYVGGAERTHQLNWMNDFLSILKQYDIGWSYWNYKNLDFGLKSEGEQLFSTYPQYSNLERIDAELVEVLSNY